MKRVIAGVAAWLFCGVCQLPAERLPIRTYTTSDGLARDKILAIRSDPSGYLWFCTSEGLTRFDGAAFVTYDRRDGLDGRSVSDLLVDRNGTYWVSLDEEGLYTFEPASRSRTDAAGRPLFRRVEAVGLPGVDRLLEDSDGSILCGTEVGLFRVAGSRLHPSIQRIDLGRDVEGDSHAVRALAKSAGGAVWVGTESGLYRIGVDRSVTDYRGESPPHIKALLVDRNGNLWIGAYGGMAIVPSESKDGSLGPGVEFPVGPDAGGGVRALLQRSDGAIWCATYGGVAEIRDGLSNSTRQIRAYGPSAGLSDATVLAIGEDVAGNLWLGTESGGAMRLARNGLTTYTEADGLTEGRIAQIFERRTGDLCVVTSGMRIHELDAGGAGFLSVHPDIPKDVTLSWGWGQFVLQSRTGEWWIPTAGGLARFSATDRLADLARVPPKAFYTRNDGLPGEEIFRLFEDSRGDVWIGTLNPDKRTLARWDRGTGEFQTYETRDGLLTSAPTAFCEMPNGDLWIGFYDGGLCRLRDGRFRPFSTEDGIPAGLVNRLFRDRSGRLWIATARGGLGRVDNPEDDRLDVRAYGREHGLSSLEVRDVVEDDLGRIYIGTGSGLDRLDPTTGQVRHYRSDEGLANNYVSVLGRTHDGDIWVGTLQGLSRFRSAPEPGRDSAAPVINGLSVDGAPHPVAELGARAVDGIEALAGSLKIDFAAPSHHAGEDLEYEYRLLGANEAWGPPTAERSVHYAHLAPGRYRFEVRLSEHGPGGQPALAGTVSFVVLPPIWRRWWFISLLAAVVSVSAYSFYHHRVARLQALLSVRTRIAQDLHDDIGTSLSRIAVLSEVVKSQSQDAREETVTLLSAIADTAREATDATSDVVWAIDPRRDDLSSVVDRIRAFASDVLDSRSIRWDLTAPPDRDRVRLSPERRRHVLLILKEAINNAARHSGCGTLRVSLVVRDARLVGSISDDGRGLSAEAAGDGSYRRGGHGMVSMRNRAAAMGGDLDVRTAKGSGTEIVFSVPIKTA